MPALEQIGRVWSLHHQLAAYNGELDQSSQAVADTLHDKERLR